MVEIAQAVRIAEHELKFTAERSPGPGGQNVNKANTRVTLHFDVNTSVSLSAAQKSVIRQSLGSRIGKDGVLKIVSSKERTQLANRRAAVSRLIELLSEVFEPAKTRKAGQPPVSADRERLNGKSRQSTVKRLRRSPALSEE